MDLWVHLRAEEGEQTNPVPFSQVVSPPAGHEQGLVLHHLSVYHYRGGEPQGLAQGAVCRMEKGRQSGGCNTGGSVSSIRPRD